MLRLGSGPRELPQRYNAGSERLSGVGSAELALEEEEEVAVTPMSAIVGKMYSLRRGASVSFASSCFATERSVFGDGSDAMNAALSNVEWCLADPASLVVGFTILLGVLMRKLRLKCALNFLAAADDDCD